VRVAAALPGSEPRPSEVGEAEQRGARETRFGDEVVEAAVFGQGRAEVEGPAIFELPGSTLVVPPGWHAEGGEEAVVMERAS
jgi:N-methylhydantoinase A/oxoprolinase/acetone carboxylase beta subunit